MPSFPLRELAEHFVTPQVRHRAFFRSLDVAGQDRRHRGPHPKPSRDQFVAAYRKAGGCVELYLFNGVGKAFMTNDPTSSQSQQALEKIIEFVHRELG